MPLCLQQVIHRPFPTIHQLYHQSAESAALVAYSILLIPLSSRLMKIKALFKPNIISWPASASLLLFLANPIAIQINSLHHVISNNSRGETPWLFRYLCRLKQHQRLANILDAWESRRFQKSRWNGNIITLMNSGWSSMLNRLMINHYSTDCAIRSPQAQGNSR
jgi:hypothetical protein